MSKPSVSTGVARHLAPVASKQLRAFLPQFVSPSEPLVLQLVVLGSICVALNTIVDVVAVFVVHRLLESNAARAARARLMNRMSGVTMIGLAAFLALASRET